MYSCAPLLWHLFACPELEAHAIKSCYSQKLLSDVLCMLSRLCVKVQYGALVSAAGGSCLDVSSVMNS